MTQGRSQGLTPLLTLSVVLVLVVVGLAQGLWLPNLHNGLLALAFTGVGAYVLHQRPGHLVGRLMMVAGPVSAVMFLGRQIGHADTSTTADWWAWVGTWPVPLSICLVTIWVLCFPDGRLPTRRWRPVVVVAVAASLFSTVLSAGWPVGYVASGVGSTHPLNEDAPSLVQTLWDVTAVPTFTGLQLLWVVVLVVRWRGGASNRALAWLLGAAAVSGVALVAGMAVAGTPRAGLLTTVLIPLAAGIAVVHGQQSAAHSALTWLSRSDADARRLPAELARATAEALHADRATLWLGSDRGLHVVGLWPESADEPAPTTWSALQDAGPQVRPVRRDNALTGALAVERVDPLSRAEATLLDDLARQARLVLDQVGLIEAIAAEQRAGHLEGLTARERAVLELVARGLSNAAICDELHLSIKTVEPVVGSIFAKLGLHADSASNRRVLAALAYMRAG